MGELVSQRVEGSNRQTLPSVNAQIFHLSLGLRRRFLVVAIAVPGASPSPSLTTQAQAVPAKQLAHHGL